MKRSSIVFICLFVGIALTIFLVKNSSPYKDSYYSKQLIQAIENEDIHKIQQVLNKRPSCINAPTSCIPLGLYTLITEYRMNYPIIEACAVDNYEIVDTLIKSGANVNLNNGLTPLSITYEFKSDNWYEISLLLINNGATLDYTTEYSGGKPSVFLDIVSVSPSATLPGCEPKNEEKVIEVFNYALENCDHSNVDWMRVLQQSVSNDRIEIVKLLLDQKFCDVNDASVGMTALMFAARDSVPEMVQLLLDYGADKSIKSADGKTAYDYAVQSNNKDIIALLKD